jgi:hypothetical protein
MALFSHTFYKRFNADAAEVPGSKGLSGNVVSAMNMPKMTIEGVYWLII